jgi:hypothetical protein
MDLDWLLKYALSSSCGFYPAFIWQDYFFYKRTKVKMLVDAIFSTDFDV